MPHGRFRRDALVKSNKISAVNHSILVIFSVHFLNTTRIAETSLLIISLSELQGRWKSVRAECAERSALIMMLQQIMWFFFVLILMAEMTYI